MINDVAQLVNNDPQIGGKLKVVLIPDYSVSLAQLIIPAADLPEQVSLVGTEASGINNAKFGMNGALTIDMLDGANTEMREYVREDNTSISGNTANQVETLRRDGHGPRHTLEKDEELHQVLTQIGMGVFSPQEPERYRKVLDSSINFDDCYWVSADYHSYADCQDSVDKLYHTPRGWTTKIMHDTANMGYLSPDRMAQEYTDYIWRIAKIRV